MAALASQPFHFQLPLAAGLPLSWPASVPHTEPCTPTWARCKGGPCNSADLPLSPASSDSGASSSSCAASGTKRKHAPAPPTQLAAHATAMLPTACSPASSKRQRMAAAPPGEVDTCARNNCALDLLTMDDLACAGLPSPLAQLACADELLDGSDAEEEALNDSQHSEQSPPALGAAFGAALPAAALSQSDLAAAEGGLLFCEEDIDAAEDLAGLVPSPVSWLAAEDELDLCASAGRASTASADSADSAAFIGFSPALPAPPAYDSESPTSTGVCYHVVDANSLVGHTATTYGFTPYEIAVGTSYFTRLTKRDAGLAAAATLSPDFRAFVAPTAQLVADEPGMAFWLRRALGDTYWLLAVHLACIYLAAKVCEQLRYKHLLRTMLSHLAGQAVSLDAAGELEMECLQGLNWRLGPHFREPIEHF